MSDEDRKAFAFNSTQAVVANRPSPATSPEPSVQLLSTGGMHFSVWGREALVALREAVNFALCDERRPMQRVAWATPEDLVQDGYSHSFTAHQTQPGHRDDWVPLYMESEESEL